MKLEKVIFNSLKKNIIGIKSIPDNIPTSGVILFHGLTNNKTDCPLITETSQALVKNGFITFRFDYFGSGESPGNMQDKTLDILLKNSKDAVSYMLNDKRVTNIGLWGRSIGGTMVCLTPPHPRIKARVSASGGVILEKSFKSIFSQVKNKQKRLEKTGKKVPGTGKFKGKYNFNNGWYISLRGIDEKIINNLQKIDTMLVFGTTPDIKVPLSNACQIINTVKEPKKLVIFENTDHAYKGAEQQAVDESVRWFRKYLS